ncbi:T9SS type A sorting domain-containing protein [candidate division KSB1 bacterium]|nr:T9SS type A sorting domain-containing protein [candidate division KSB1 bacterium]
MPYVKWRIYYLWEGESYKEYRRNFVIYTRQYNSSGVPVGNEFPIYIATHSSLIEPKIVQLTTGQFVICWNEVHRRVGFHDIICQVLNPDCSKRGSEFQVNTEYSPQGYDHVKNLCALLDGGFFISWSSSEWDIVGKIYKKEMNHPLISFSLLKPEYDITLDSTQVLFTWNAATALRINLPYEVEYQLYLADNTDFFDPQIFKAIYDTCYSATELLPGTTYFWKVLAKNISGDSIWSSQVNAFFTSHNAPVIQRNNDKILESFRLFNNFPNPFTTHTTIQFYIPENLALYPVSVKVYNIQGQLVKILNDGGRKLGFRTSVWNGRDEHGYEMCSGIYYCMVRAGQYSAIQKMLYIK